MKAYVLFQSLKSVPQFRDALVFIFNESFRKRLHCGFGQPFKNGRAEFAHFAWSAWQDNRELPEYADTFHLWVSFYPFKPKPNRSLLSSKKRLRYRQLARIMVTQHHVPVAAHRAFHRLVYKYALDTQGIVYDPSLNQFFSSSEYRYQYRSFIDRPFRLHLKASDLKRVKRGLPSLTSRSS